MSTDITYMMYSRDSLSASDYVDYGCSFPKGLFFFNYLRPPGPGPAPALAPELADESELELADESELELADESELELADVSVVDPVVEESGVVSDVPEVLISLVLVVAVLVSVVVVVGVVVTTTGIGIGGPPHPAGGPNFPGPPYFGATPFACGGPPYDYPLLFLGPPPFLPPLGGPPYFFSFYSFCLFPFAIASFS